MNLKTLFRKYLKLKYAAKLVNALLILTMLLTSLPMATQAATPERQRQVDPCIAPLDGDGNPTEDDPEPESSMLYLPIVIQAARLFGASNLLGQLQAPLQVTRELNYEVGKTYTYDYVVEVASKSYQRTVEGEGQTGNNTTIVKMDADITIESQNDDGSFEGRIELNNPSVCSTDGTNEEIADTDGFSAELQKPLKFTQAANGVITSVQIPEGSNATATNMQKGVINALQMTLQAEDTYTVEEAGGQGKYSVTYELSEADGTLGIKKSYDQDSFTEQNREGDETNAFTLDTSLEATLDSTKGILTSVTGAELIETGDGVEDPDGSNTEFAGATAWTTIETKTQLTFDSVSEASLTIRAAALNLVYQEDSLGANFESDTESPSIAEIDVDTLDLAAEIQALVDDTENLEQFLRILDLIAIDDTTGTLDAIATKLNENADNETVTIVLIDLLIEAGTPYAQDILSGILGNDTIHAAGLSATMSMTTTEHALIGLVLVDSPTITTANTVQALGGQEGDLQETAISVLGATIDKLADNGDEETSSALTEELLASLGDAATEEELELYIGALGNASQPDTLDEIAKYITDTLTLGNGTEITETTGIRFAALSAAGNFDGEQAEGILVAALTDEDELLGFRLTAFDALAGRSDLSAAALGALNANASLGSIGTEGEGSDFEEDGGNGDVGEGDVGEDGGVIAAGADAVDLTVSRNWNKRFGNSKLGVELPGLSSARTPPHYNGLYLYGQQKANALVWNRTINLVNGRLQFWRNTSTSYQFGAYLDLLNYRIRKKYERDFNCAWARNAMLWQGSQRAKFNYRIPILAIMTIGVEINLGVHVRLDYRLNANVCHPAVEMRSTTTIIPSGYATATANAYLSLWLVRGGVGVMAKILNTRLVLSLIANANAINLTARFCVWVKVETQALSGRVYAYADRRLIFGPWRRRWTGNLASFSAPRQTITLWHACWP